eukprot:Lithocolla_globosa_v1_NODE_6732_length_1043_cov_486.640688.p1 type:complete len:110 gc:universal NODE_6732_length_1043_cov_486.640688:155-484(+)
MCTSTNGPLTCSTTTVPPSYILWVVFDPNVVFYRVLVPGLHVYPYHVVVFLMYLKNIIPVLVHMLFCVGGRHLNLEGATGKATQFFGGLSWEHGHQTFLIHWQALFPFF